MLLKALTIVCFISLFTVSTLASGPNKPKHAYLCIHPSTIDSLKIYMHQYNFQGYKGKSRKRQYYLKTSASYLIGKPKTSSLYRTKAKTHKRAETMAESTKEKDKFIRYQRTEIQRFVQHLYPATIYFSIMKKARPGKKDTLIGRSCIRLYLCHQTRNWNTYDSKVFSAYTSFRITDYNNKAVFVVSMRSNNKI